MFLRKQIFNKFLTIQQCHSAAAAATTTKDTTSEINPILAMKSLRDSLKTSDYRTNEENVANHTELHAGKFYTIQPDAKKAVFGGGGLPKQYETQVKTFAETCLMVRQPALELLDYVRNTDLTKPTVRYVLYGEKGVGKSLTLAHLLHYGYQNGFILVHVPWVANWMKRPKETAAVEDNLIDLPFDAAAWLLHFKNQNTHLLAKLDLKTSKDYEWSKRESTAAGSSLLQLVDHGIARIKFASRTVSALLQELKQLATDGHCKVFVAIDGYNAFFHPITRILSTNKQVVTPDRITLTQPFLDITNYNWTNGICVLTVDEIVMTEGYMESYMPRYLLGREGFEHLDPFVPLHIPNYTDKEFHSCIQYYIDRLWIQKTPDGFEEQLKYLSNKNPYRLMCLTQSL